MSDFEIDEDSGSNESFDRCKTVGSDEDTEDASETDQAIKHQEYVEMKEQMYQEKLANLKEQLRQLHAREHPEYLKRIKKLDEKYEEEINLTKAFEKVMLERIERDYEQEKLAAQQEFEEKRSSLRENLIQELELKKKLIEAERNNMDLTSEDNLLEMTELPIMRRLLNEDKNNLEVADVALIRKLVLEDLMDPKPIHTRRLRRRANETAPAPEKKRKTFSQMTFLLDEKEIDEDVAFIKNCLKNQDAGTSQDQGAAFDVKVEDEKLQYNKKWFQCGQKVYYEGKDVGTKNPGVILSITPSEICIKRNSTNKVHITVPQLQTGAFILKKRS